MAANKRSLVRPGLFALALASVVVLTPSALAGNGWGNDRVPDTNDATCDDDEGTGNDARCSGSGGTSTKGHGYGNDRVPDSNDATCDDDEGTGNDWKCMGTSKN